MATLSTTDPGERTIVRLVLIVLAALVLAPVFTMAFGMPVMAGMGWHDGAMVGTTPWWSVGMWLVWLAVLAVIGYLVYRVAVGPAGREGDTALRELRLAYARGDITDEEFETRRVVLTDERTDEP